MSARAQRSDLVDDLIASDELWRAPELVDAIARRLRELEHEDFTPEMLTVADVAKRLRVSAKWVYAHQRELGAIRLGDGPKPRLRFDPQTIEARLLSDRAADPPDERASTQNAQRAKRRRRLASRPLPALNRRDEAYGSSS